MSRKSVERLGKRLKKASSLSEDDLRELAEYRAAHTEALDLVVRQVCEVLPRIPPVATRTKTVGTILDKLRREHGMPLHRMQDIAGVRIVVSGGRMEQNRVVDALRERFPDCRVKDRRSDPSFGYRAVHLIVDVDDRFVEIQVRTERQHKWAQVMEKLGDIWGRGIRYGGDPESPEALAGPGTTRGEVVREIRDFADALDEFEQVELEYDIARATESPLPAAEEELSKRRRDVDDLLRSLATLTP